MPVYTVHAPLSGRDGSAAADRFVFVRDGFHLWAAVFGVLWFLVHRLWLAAAACLAVVTLAVLGAAMLPVSNDVRTIVVVLLAVLIGFEAATLWRWTLSRGRWRQLDVVVARNRHDAEHRFFERWSAGRGGAGDTPSGDQRAAAPLKTFGSNGGAGEIMGLFPQPGSSR
jgi:hypothetical protein